MKKIENNFKILLANLFNVPINTCTGPIRDEEIETLTYQINNSLFRKRARNILFERLKEQKEIMPIKAYNIIDKTYASHIDTMLASVIIDKMHQYGFGFMSMDNEQIVKMARKVGYTRLIYLFKEDSSSFKTFIDVFNLFSEDEKKKAENVKAYLKYFSGQGLAYVNHTEAEPVLNIIKTTVPQEKARPIKFENGIKDGNDWPAYFGEKLFEKIYMMQ